ncbi:GntR family transcriptional regulator YhfZ [Vibrio sp.]|uniref:GntR family transcriptional regulator YhfZ n=1 Tax=Vibrio sp. TaxID=678 RepID=UPI003AA9C3AB
MTKRYIKKNGVAILKIARYLLTAEVGDRLKTIDELSGEIGCSVGYVAKAIKHIEAENAVYLTRQGRNGTIISALDFRLLITLSEIDNIVCAMPLPYTKHYEGLASGLKQQINMVPFYFAHMRGAEVRAECLKNGIYDLAIMSKLAAEKYVAEGELEIAIELKAHSYVPEHRLIYRSGQLNDILRVGVDFESIDQKLLTELFFTNKKITIVSIPYNECLDKISSGEIDAAIWYTPRHESLQSLGLSEEPLDIIPEFDKASIAVFMVRKNSDYLKIMLSNIIDQNQLLQHQNDVISGVVIPTY